METLNKDAQKEIGQFVADDFRTAAVFSKYKIDFCCNGNRTVEEACDKKGIDSNMLVDELNEVLKSGTNESIDYKSWPLDLLAEYIEKKHHRYVEEKIPVLRQFLDKLCRVHGERHPELFKINDLFTASAGELASHMKKEELILFPFVKRMVNATIKNEAIQSPQFGTVENPIAMMKHEHDTEGERYREIAELTNNYNPPADACNTYKVTYAMLDEFEKDLHLHIHLENNILFPKAVKLEQQFV
ncbi:iron-sulfur cluster repair di-iron protein [Algibacter amylolyticus]|uniref:Iron-sulfur cluster repair di-iron protein n=1 Tax=Algibacter amylolyticus TaxID=1608400 RepID=A0A5M7BGX7_9FLAO|nr:iron-sulfur cluster repair di-iron protein [Algibacter amylolyticus]KAA5827698.1 iron-sulfur cluster repair di-iron protein [Algibacter amylolyticus]MBB5266915.1 regulator of cell morphogenesis and NO signaling [Algibacter amylolyticus]TSJ81943.1 iron-sulfur cluster repair di-iron protein [Algibacter amylolyticus]